MSRRNELLFCEHDLFHVLEHQEGEMKKAVDEMGPRQCLEPSLDSLVDELFERFKCEAPVLNVDGIHIEQEEVDIDVRYDRNRCIDDRSRPVYMKGTRITYVMPFAGDGILFKCRPQSFSINPPQGRVDEQALLLTFERTDHDAAAIKSEFQHALTSIQQYLASTVSQVQQFNVPLPDKIRARLTQRREKHLNDQGVAANLGYPLRKRNDVPTSYTVPTVRRKITPKVSSASVGSFVPEPALAMEHYEHILKVISDMALLMERSPHAFKHLGEEDLRTHLLFPLNGHYEGGATGETFNFEGKTDILIRHQGNNIFVAECKIWNGPKALTDAIDQLLAKYVCWRDTKTAILLFNRKKDFSAVLAKIPEVVQAHSNCRRRVEYTSETGFRFIFSHYDDCARELTLTVLAFDVPSDTDETK